MFKACQNNAKQRGHCFELTKEQFKEIICKHCYYCGDSPRDFNAHLKKNGELKNLNTNPVSVEASKRAWIKANTVDRLDSDIGYIKNNCVPACINCNYMKRTLKENDFLFHVYKIIKYQEMKNEPSGT